MGPLLVIARHNEHNYSIRYHSTGHIQRVNVQCLKLCKGEVSVDLWHSTNEDVQILQGQIGRRGRPCKEAPANNNTSVKLPTTDQPPIVITKLTASRTNAYVEIPTASRNDNSKRNGMRAEVSHGFGLAISRHPDSSANGKNGRLENFQRLRLLPTTTSYRRQQTVWPLFKYKELPQVNLVFPALGYQSSCWHALALR